MNLRTSLKITEVLALASVRVKSRGSMTQGRMKIWQYTNITMGALLTVFAAFIVYYEVRNLGLSDLIIKAVFNQILFFIPAAMTFSCIMFSLMYEFNQSAFNTSLDSINWLPISAGDYVLGSSLCTIYFSLPILGLVFGSTLALAFMTQSYIVWALSIVLGLFGGLLGGFATEILRALTNKATTTIFSKGGKTSIIGRFLVYMIFLSAFMLAFNTTTIVWIAEWFNEVAGGSWFFPLFWPSLAVLSLLVGDYLMTAVYFTLTLFLTFSFFVIGSNIRERNWVPEPIAVLISSADSVKSLKSTGGFLGFSGIEAKIIQKDLRGLFRRREMMVYLALPFIMIIITTVSEGFGALFNPMASPAEKLDFFISVGVGVLYLAFFLSITSIGQEGGAAINLVSAPIKVESIARAKLVSTLILPSILFTLMVAAIIILVKPDFGLFALILSYGLSIITETSEVGLIFGSKFVDYNEVPRARFTRPEGIIMGMLAVVATIVVNLGALIFVEKLGLRAFTITAQAIMISILGVTINFVLLKLIKTQIIKALEKAPN